MEKRWIVFDILQVLESAPRIGADSDIPEGSRYIQISDTLANKLADEIRLWLDDIVPAGDK